METPLGVAGVRIACALENHEARSASRNISRQAGEAIFKETAGARVSLSLSGDVGGEDVKWCYWRWGRRRREHC